MRVVAENYEQTHTHTHTHETTIVTLVARMRAEGLIIAMMRDGGHPVLSLYDLEKAYDSIEHPILLKALFEAGVNGKAWRIVKAYGNL